MNVRLARRATGAVFLAVSCIAAAACSSSAKSAPQSSGATDSAPTSATASSVAASGPAYKIGYAGDMTGSLSNFGQPMYNGFKTEIDAVNKAGGVNGHQIDLVLQDYHADVNAARLAVNTLHNEGALAMFGGLSGSAWGPLASLASQDQMAQITIGVSDSQIVPPQPYVYSSQLAASSQASLMLQFLQQKLGPGSHSVAFIGFSSSYVQGFVSSLQAQIQSLGWKLVSNQTIPTSATNVSTQAQSIVSAKPDAVLGYLLDPSVPLTVTALTDSGFSGLIVNSVAGDQESTFKAVNNKNFYALMSYVYPLDPTVPGAVSMIQQAKGAGTTAGDESIWFTAGYAQGLLAVAALKGCGSNCTGASYNQALEAIGTVDAKGLTGDLALSPTRHRAIAAGEFAQWDSSKGLAVPVTGWLKTNVGVTQ